MVPTRDYSCFEPVTFKQTCVEKKGSFHVFPPGKHSTILLPVMDKQRGRLQLSKPGPDADLKSDDRDLRKSFDLGDGSEVVYIPRFLKPDRSWELFDYLNEKIPWTRPSIQVFGRLCVQPRDMCYVASKGLQELRYSGFQPHAHSWEEFPLLLEILKAVEKTLPESSFNSLLLNRYNSGSDYVSWHSDDEKLYGPTPEIASVSFGCERDFLIRKRVKQASLAQASSKKAHNSNKRLKTSHPEQHSFVLKHGSLLVMRGYTQRDWVHSVPKRAKAEAIRINLTFRKVMT